MELILKSRLLALHCSYSSVVIALNLSTITFIDEELEEVSYWLRFRLETLYSPESLNGMCTFDVDGDRAALSSGHTWDTIYFIDTNKRRLMYALCFHSAWKTPFIYASFCLNL